MSWWSVKPLQRFCDEKWQLCAILSFYFFLQVQNFNSRTLCQLVKFCGEIWGFFQNGGCLSFGFVVRIFGDVYHCAKFGWNWCSCFDNMQVLVFCDFGWKMPIHAHFLRGGLGTFCPRNVTHRLNLKKDRPWVEPHHLSHKAWISAAQFELGEWRRKKDRTGK